MTTVVVNSSPIIGLSMINKINLLWQLFDQVYLTQAVFHEITNNASARFFGKDELLQAINNSVITIYTIQDNDLAKKLIGKLHLGEVETIIVAKELTADFVVIDDLAARNLSSLFSITSIGVIGILRLAKRKQLISEIKSYLEQLREMKFRISDKIMLEILKNENEL